MKSDDVLPEEFIGDPVVKGVSLSLDTPLQLPKETLSVFKGDELRARVFYEKYSLRDEVGRPTEKIPDEMWHRVAREIASVEKTLPLQAEWENKFYWLLKEWKFIPGGRILFGAGQNRRATLLNCYFLGRPADSIEDIFDMAKKMARTYSYGGGVGIDISDLRPKGTPVNNSAINSTGAVSFMELYSVTTGTIGQAGRRGALMISISVEHPDVVDFVTIKKDLKKVNYANVSVRVTDAFMKAVENDERFTLHFKNDKVDMEKTIRARDLWDKLVKAAWESAEPGLLFWDTSKRFSTTEYNGMEIQGVNPCSEETLETMGTCCLGSINLAAFVVNPFSENPYVDWDNLRQAAEYATRFLDNVLDYNADRHPLPEQKIASLRSRRIGVGVTGLGDMLIKLRKKYDTEETINYVDHLMNDIKVAIYAESVELAKEKVPAPAFEAKKHLAQPFIQRLPDVLKKDIEAYGLRNAALMTVPPVGSGSILTGTSSGIEPVFAFAYTRRSKSLSQGEFKVNQPIVEEYITMTGNEGKLPSYFVASHQIDPEMRVKMQAAVQQHVDTAVSSTVNLPEKTTIETVDKIYFQAWKAGCKGITVYREGSREGILETEEKTAPTLDEHGELFERPRVMYGGTIKMRLSHGSLYVTVNSNGAPKEVFVELGKSGAETKADAEAIGRLISLYLQSGGTIDNAIKSLRGIQGGVVSWDSGTKLLSIPDAVAKALENLTKPEAAGKEELQAIKAKQSGVKAQLSDVKLETCPDCKEESLLEQSGCVVCQNCGYSRC